MPNKKIIISAIVIIVILFGAGGFYIFKIKNKPKEAASPAAPAEEAGKNYFEIHDELAGVSFRISKNFDRLPTQQLQLKNPSFIYGFSMKDDENVNCFVSQTKRESGGQVTVGQLRDGVLEQLKKSNSDARVDESKVIDIGKHNNKGIKLKMSFTEVDKTPMVQWEAVGITDKNATFVFCNSPKAVIELYQDDLDLFLDSVKIE